jgi:hypothetical protein
MANLKRIFPALLVSGALFIVPGCASEQAEYTTNRVTNDTGSTVGSVFDATGHVVMYPFHLVGDLFS